MKLRNRLNALLLLNIIALTFVKGASSDSAIIDMIHGELKWNGININEDYLA